MAWPAAATKTNLDSGSDSPSLARAELADLVDKFNQLREAAAPREAPSFVGALAIGNATTYGYKLTGVSSNQLDVSDSSLVVVNSGSAIKYFTNYVTRQRFVVLNVTGTTITIAASAGNWAQFTLPASSAAEFVEYGGGLYRIS